VQLHVVGGAGVPTLPSFGAADALAITNNANANLVWVTSNTGQAQIKVYGTSTLTGTQCYDNSTSQWRFGANATNASTSSDVMIGSNHKFGIGTATTDPTAYLQIATAGTTTAGTAPLKLTSGTNLTSPEAGSIEYDGTNLFFSPSTVRQTVMKALVGSASLNFGGTPIAAGGNEELTITVTGAADGDEVILGIPNASFIAGVIYTARVSATNTVSVQAVNTTASPADPGSGTFKVSVIKR